MNSLQLEIHMKTDSWIAKYYGGVLPRDLLPTSPMKPSFYVVNQDESSEAGSHWIVVFMQDNKITEYFDPLGKVPDQHFKDYMSFQSDNYLYNRKRCQNYQSNLCGQYCLFYCYVRAREYSMQNILDMFDENNLMYNDQLVYFFYAYTK